MSAISVVNSLDLLRAIDEAYKEKKTINSHFMSI